MWTPDPYSGNLFSRLLRWGPEKAPLVYEMKLRRKNPHGYLYPRGGVSADLGDRSGIPYGPFEAAVLAALGQLKPADLFSDPPPDPFDLLKAQILGLEGEDVTVGHTLIRDWETHGAPHISTWQALWDMERRFPALYASCYAPLYRLWCSTVGQARALVNALRFLIDAEGKASDADRSTVRGFLRDHIRSGVERMHVSSDITEEEKRTIRVAIFFVYGGTREVWYDLPPNPCAFRPSPPESPRDGPAFDVSQPLGHGLPEVDREGMPSALGDDAQPAERDGIPCGAGHQTFGPPPDGWRERMHEFKRLLDAMDPVLEATCRLAIVSALANAPRLTFTALRDGLAMTDGNLSRHLRHLEEAKYVVIEKRTVEGRSQTSCFLTKEGVTALWKHIYQLEAIVRLAKG